MLKAARRQRSHWHAQQLRTATNAQLGIKDIREARRWHIPFVAEEGQPTAHIISPLTTYSDGTAFKEN